MPRSVNAVARRARRKKIMKQAKGYFGRRKNVWTVAKNAVEKADAKFLSGTSHGHNLISLQLFLYSIQLDILVFPKQAFRSP